MKKIITFLFLMLIGSSVFAQYDYANCMRDIIGINVKSCAQGYYAKLISRNPLTYQNIYNIPFAIEDGQGIQLKCHTQTSDTTSADFSFGYCLYPTSGLVVPATASLVKSLLENLKRPLLMCGSILNITEQSAGEDIQIGSTEFYLSYQSKDDSKGISQSLVRGSFQFADQAYKPSRQVVLKSLGGVRSAPFKVLEGQNSFDYSLIPTNDSISSVGYLKVMEADLELYETQMPPFQFDSTVPSFQITRGESPARLVSSERIVKRSLDREVFGLGGWSLRNVHFYDPIAKEIYWGSGSKEARELPTKNISLNDNVYLGTNESGSEVYIFDMQGRHVETKTPLIGATKYKFNYRSDNKLSSIIDADGNLTMFDRDGAGNLRAIIDSFGSSTAIQLNQNGRLQKITSPGGKSHSFEYDLVSGQLSKITYPSGLVTSFAYNSDGKFYREEKSTGGLTLVNTQVVGPVINFITQTAQAVYKSYSSATEDMNTTRTTNSDGLLVSLSSYSETSESYLTSSTQTTTQVAQDARFGAQVRFPASIVNSNFGEQNLSSSILNAQSVNYQYGDGPFNLASLKVDSTVSGQIYSTQFDGVNNQINFVSPMGLSSTITLDAKERPIQFSADGSTGVDISYNSLGQINSLRNGVSEFQYLYNNKGQVSEVHAPGGRITKYNWDLDGRLLQKTLPNGDSVSYAYTGSGAFSSVTTPNGNTHSFQSDLLEKMTSYIAPSLSGVVPLTNYVYDTDSRLTKMTDPDGLTAEITYQNNSNRISSIKAGLNTTLFASWDPSDRPGVISNSDGVTVERTWTGDRLASSQTTVDGVMLPKIVYEYDSQMRISQITVGANVIPYAYNADGRMSQAGLETYEYDIKTQTMDLGGGRSGDYGHRDISYSWPSMNLSGQYVSTDENDHSQGDILPANFSMNMLSMSANQKSHFLNSQLNTDANGNANFTYLGTSMSGEEIQHDVYRNSNYLYDLNSRLTKVTAEKYVIDHGEVIEANPENHIGEYVFGAGSNNNISSYKNDGKITQGTYDAQDRLINLTGAVSRNFTYNNSGRLKKILNCLGSKQFEYDIFGNLTKVTLPNGQTIAYKMDGLNRRVARYVNGQIDEYYIWYDSTHLAGVVKPSGDLDITYVYGALPIAPIYLLKSGIGRVKILSSPKGDILSLVSEQGDLVQDKEFDEYGNLLNDSSVRFVGQKPFQPLGYASGLTDYQTSLVRFGARDYDPSIGRWTAKDPIGFGGGDTNLYAYVGQNPVSYVDPSGLAGCTFSGGVLSCTSNDGRRTVSLNAFTGAGSAFSENGKIPAGTYDIRKLPNSDYGTWYLDPGLLSRGLYRAGLVRGGFNIHTPGNSSNGCVTARRRENNAGDIYNFNQLLTDEMGSNTLTVLPYGN